MPNISSLKKDKLVADFLEEKILDLTVQIGKFNTIYDEALTKQYSEQPSDRNEGETDRDYKKREITRRIGRYLQTSRKPYMINPHIGKAKCLQKVSMSSTCLREVYIDSSTGYLENLDKWSAICTF